MDEYGALAPSEDASFAGVDGVRGSSKMVLVRKGARLCCAIISFMMLCVTITLFAVYVYLASGTGLPQTVPYGLTGDSFKVEMEPSGMVHIRAKTKVSCTRIGAVCKASCVNVGTHPFCFC